MGVGVEKDRRPLVLLVDDDADLLDLAEVVLYHAGLLVVTASNGRRALSALEVLEPAVIVTELMMPEIDGLEFIRQYLGRPGVHAPIIAVSGFLPYLDEARRLGAAATMYKPYNPRALAQQIFDIIPGERAHVAGVKPPLQPRHDEEARLRALLDLRLEEAEPDLKLQKFLDEIAEIFAVPVAGISAVTSERQRLVAQCLRAGDPDPGGERAHSFCTHAVSSRAALVIQDALENPLFRDNPSVTERGFRFYAGVPLMAAHGDAVGTLCILDYAPHQFSYVDLELLGMLGRRVLAAFEWRDKHEHKDMPDSSYRYLQLIDDQLDIYGKGVFGDLVVLEASRAVAKEEPVALVALAVRPEDLEEAASTLRELFVGGLVGRLGRAQLAAVARGKVAKDARDTVARSVTGVLEIVATDLDQYEGATGHALLEVEHALESAGVGSGLT